MTAVPDSMPAVAPPLVERVLAPRADEVLLAMLRDGLAHVPRRGRVLDVGTGARSRIAATGRYVVAVDRNARLIAASTAGDGFGIAATAIALPFADRTFDAIASLGVLHHLSNADARATVRERLRVTRADGRIALFDSVLPEPARRRPLAWAIRRADPGRFVRRAAALRALLSDASRWRVTRLTYAWTGLEGLWCARA